MMLPIFFLILLFLKNNVCYLFLLLFKKSLGKISNTSFTQYFLTLPIMNPINQIFNPNIQIHI